MSTQQRNAPPQESLMDTQKTVRMGLVGMNIMAGSHRLLHYWFFTPGCRAIDRWVWIGVAFAYPLAVTIWPPVEVYQHRNAYRLWLALLALAFIHSSAAFWSWADRHSQEIGKPLFGRLEIPVAVLAALLASSYCGPGAGILLGAGLAANLVQIALIRARFRRMAAIQRDAEIEAGEFRLYKN